jgi:hypothetical protein
VYSCASVVEGHTYSCDFQFNDNAILVLVNSRNLTSAYCEGVEK